MFVCSLKGLQLKNCALSPPRQAQRAQTMCTSGMLSLIDAMHPYLIHPPPFDGRVPHNNAIRNSVTTGEFCMFVGGVIGRLMKFRINSGRNVGIFVQIFKHRSEIDSLDLDDKDVDMEIVSSGNIELVRTNLGRWFKPKDIQRLVFPLHFTSLTKNTFGPTAGRSSVYAWQHDVVLDNRKWE